MDEKVNRDDIDTLYLSSVYPDAAELFSFAPTKLSGVMDSAIFVLDTNALLVPYGATPASLDAIRTTYSKLIKDGRLVVPAQAAREFAKHRPERIKVIFDQLARRHSTSFQPVTYPLLTGSENYKALQACEAELNAKLDDYRKAVKELIKEVREWHWDDPVSLIYREMFRGTVVMEAGVDATELKKDLAFRNTHKVPPGYKDGGKDLNTSGDLLIWRTILRLGQDKKLPVVFVSGEEKADWWHRASEGPLYPRHELLDEYRRASGGKSFHIVALADLLEKFGVPAPVVEEVREQEATANTSEPADLVLAEDERLRRRMLEAALEWLLRQGRVEHEGGALTLTKADGSKIAVLLRTFRDATGPFSSLKVRIGAWFERAASAGDPFMLVIVTDSRPDALALAHRVSRRYADFGIDAMMPASIIEIGHLRGDEFSPVAAVSDRGVRLHDRP